MGDRIQKPGKITLNFPNQIVFDPSKVRLTKVQVVPTFLRRIHWKTTPVVELLDINVAKEYFSKTIEELHDKSQLYDTIWKIRDFFFPIILIDVLSMNRETLYVLSINLRNYNYYPPEIGILSSNSEVLFLEIDPKAKIVDREGNVHVKDRKNGVWFCTPGTYSYHDFYFDIDRWEIERYNDTCEILEIINRVIGMIDRNRESLEKQRNGAK